MSRHNVRRRWARDDRCGYGANDINVSYSIGLTQTCSGWGSIIEAKHAAEPHPTLDPFGPWLPRLMIGSLAASLIVLRGVGTEREVPFSVATSRVSSGTPAAIPGRDAARVSVIEVVGAHLPFAPVESTPLEALRADP
jgi:hypothetical protein